MEYPVKVYEIARDAKPEARPMLAGDFAVSADTVEDARRAVVARLVIDGRPVRSLSFTADGGLAAVVHPAPAPPVAPPRAARRAKGGR